MVPQDALFLRAELCDGGLTAGISHIDHELDPHRAAIKGVIEQQELGFRIDRPGPRVGMEEGRTDLDTAMQRPDRKEARRAHHPAIGLAPDGIANALAPLGFAQGLRPEGLEPLAASIDRHDLPRLRITIDRGLQGLFMGGPNGFKPNITAFEGTAEEVHGEGAGPMALDRTIRSIASLHS